MGYADLTQLPESVRALVEAELQHGERVTWVEQPIPARAARSVWPLVAFAIPWTAFAIFWMVGAAAGSSRSGGLFQVFPLFGLPFVLIGLAMLSSPYWAWRSALRTVYVISDRRAIVLRAGFGGGMTVRSFEAVRLTDLRRTQYADGSGDLIFTQDVGRDSDGDRRLSNVGFMAIADVKAVEERVRALAQRSALPA